MSQVKELISQVIQLNKGASAKVDELKGQSVGTLRGLEELNLRRLSESKSPLANLVYSGTWFRDMYLRWCSIAFELREADPKDMKVVGDLLVCMSEILKQARELEGTGAIRRQSALDF